MPKKQTKDPEKFCEHCGTQYYRKVFNGRLEDRSVFLRRKYCSLTCANSKRRPLTKQGYSWRARKHLKTACEACNAITSLQAHHLNQRSSDNEPENIQTLCKHCHDFWHTTAKRLLLAIAGRMPTLYPHGLMGGKTE